MASTKRLADRVRVPSHEGQISIFDGSYDDLVDRQAAADPRVRRRPAGTSRLARDEVVAARRPAAPITDPRRFVGAGRTCSQSGSDASQVMTRGVKPRDLPATGPR